MKRLGEQVSVSFWYLADARQCAAHVRYWHKADMPLLIGFSPALSVLPEILEARW